MQVRLLIYWGIACIIYKKTLQVCFDKYNREIAMENVTQLYSAAFAVLKEVQAKEQTARRQQNDLKQQAAANLARLREQCQSSSRQLDADIRTVQAYYNLASDQTRSQRPVRDNGAKPDIAYMQQLYIRMEDEDPYDANALKLLELSAGALGYLQKQKQQLAAREAAGNTDPSQQTRAQYDKAVHMLYEKLLTGAPLQKLAAAVKSQTDPYFVKKQQLYDENVPTATAQLLKLGAVQRPFPVPAGYESKLQTLFGTYYDSQTKCLRLPFGFRTDKAVKLLVTYPDAMKDRVQNALCGLLFNIMRHYAPLDRRVLYIDPITCNPEHLGVMKYFAGDHGFIQFPTSEKAISAAIDQLIASNSGDAARRESRFLIVRGYPDHVSAQVRDKIRNICNNYEFYRISVILTGPQDQTLSAQDETALSKAVTIRSDGQRFVLQGKENAYFSWFTSPQQLTDAMRQRFTDAYAPKLLGCEYPNRVALDRLPAWKKGSRQIRVPFGVDAQDGLCTIDFTNTNFAMYLMGAAGSGKSTLLHTIITGLIRNYHPDDVELWLADFKMSEFSQYADPMPPHIKYILMDESTELVYDFVDLLTEKMMERKRYFSQNATTKKLDNVSADTYMPAIVVIIDEFSLMSQAVAESFSYKEKLQNLLTEGRALGFKFIFASQEYSNGIQGLTTAAKDQIQMRIAMKNTASEIRETLDVSGVSLPDHVSEWIKDLPPYTALYKTFDHNANQGILNRAQVMYFPGEAEQAYAPQRRLIRSICSAMKPVSRKQYSATDIHTYVYKEPVIADGTTCKVFTRKRYEEAVRDYEKKQTDMLLPEDVPVTFGDPRRLLSAAVQPLINESRENILLLGGEETACSMSVMLSAMESFRLQGGEVQVWAYRRNRIYGSYRNTHFIKYRTFDTPEQIGQAMVQLQEKIKAKTQGKELIVLLGMAHIREDLSSLEQTPAAAVAAGDPLSHLAAVTPEEQEDVAAVKQYQKDLSAEMDRIQNEGLRDGKSMEQISEECRQLFAAYRKRQGSAPPAPAPAKPAPSRLFAPSEKVDYEKAFEHIVTHGSKYGYHFLLCVRDYAEFSSTLPKLPLFAHKLAFQISADDSAYLFSNNRAAKLPEHICQYTSDHESYSFRPFLHQGVGWDDWTVDGNGNAVRIHS